MPRPGSSMNVNRRPLARWPSIVVHCRSLVRSGETLLCRVKSGSEGSRVGGRALKLRSAFDTNLLLNTIRRRQSSEEVHHVREGLAGQGVLHREGASKQRVPRVGVSQRPGAFPTGGLGSPSAESVGRSRAAAAAMPRYPVAHEDVHSRFGPDSENLLELLICDRPVRRRRAQSSPKCVEADLLEGCPTLSPNSNRCHRAQGDAG